jgi:hypothetical protein
LFNSLVGHLVVVVVVVGNEDVWEGWKVYGSFQWFKMRESWLRKEGFGYPQLPQIFTELKDELHKRERVTEWYKLYRGVVYGELQLRPLASR